MRQGCCRVVSTRTWTNSGSGKPSPWRRLSSRTRRSIPSISSPLKRAQQTAGCFGLPFETDERWIELAYGEYEGLPQADVPSGAWAQWRADTNFVPTGGESLATLDVRVRAACEDLAERASRTNVVVVSHVSPMKAAVAWALGVDIGISWNCHLDHASVCRISFKGTKPLLETFNHTARVT